MFIFEKNPKNLQKPVEYTLPDGTYMYVYMFSDGADGEGPDRWRGGGERLLRDPPPLRGEDSEASTRLFHMTSFAKTFRHSGIWHAYSFVKTW